MPLDKEQLDALRIDESERYSGGGAGRIVLWILVVVLLGIIIAAGWYYLQRQRAPAEAPPIRVATAQSPRLADSGVLDASGYVVARRLATVSSKVTGRVEQVLIEEGMAVQQGELLATLDDSSVRPLLALAESQLEAARKGLAETEVRLEEAQRQLRRTQQLRERQLVSESALDTARAEVDALDARLNASRSNVEVAARTVALRRQELADLEIRAPFSGVVVAKNAQPGEMISPISAGGGFTRTGIGTIVDMESREIEVDVNEAFINRVTPQQRVITLLDAYPDWEIPGSVINIVPTADRQRATVKVRIAFDQLDPRILPDMGVKVRFLERNSVPPAETEKIRASVPLAALHSENGQDYVWLVRNGVIERRAVTAARPGSGSQVGIVGGLSPGDEIVVSAEIELRPGLQVGGDR